MDARAPGLVVFSEPFDNDVFGLADDPDAGGTENQKNKEEDNDNHNSDDSTRGHVIFPPWVTA
jgi:hypothetical protein